MIRRTLAAIALTAVLVATVLVTAAVAGHPIGDSNYIAIDQRGRPYITLWMQTKTRMWVFACYHWAKGPRHGDHLNNEKPITVHADGTFSYDGLARNQVGEVHMKLSGHFKTGQLAVGVLTTTCAKRYHFSARRG